MLLLGGSALAATKVSSVRSRPWMMVGDLDSNYLTKLIKNWAFGECQE